MFLHSTMFLGRLDYIWNALSSGHLHRRDPFAELFHEVQGCIALPRCDFFCSRFLFPVLFASTSNINLCQLLIVFFQDWQSSAAIVSSSSAILIVILCASRFYKEHCHSKLYSSSQRGYIIMPVFAWLFQIFVYAPPSVNSQHRPTSLYPHYSMDTFTSIADIFANTSDEDASIPRNEERGGQNFGSTSYCVIAWDALFLIAYLTTVTTFFSCHPRMSSLYLKKNNLLMFSVSQKPANDAGIIIIIIINTTHTWHYTFVQLTHHRHEPSFINVLKILNTTPPWTVTIISFLCTIFFFGFEGMVYYIQNCPSTSRHCYSYRYNSKNLATNWILLHTLVRINSNEGSKNILRSAEQI